MEPPSISKAYFVSVVSTVNNIGKLKIEKYSVLTVLYNKGVGFSERSRLEKCRPPFSTENKTSPRAFAMTFSKEILKVWS